MKKSKKTSFKPGPGFIIAATGIGAGDMVAATVAGAKFGTVILWATILGALFKFVLNEGLARWQLTTQSTVLEGWIHRFRPYISYYFIAYLVLWSFVVAGALMSACGLVAHTMFPQLSIMTWGIIHSLIALVLVIVGRYRVIETVMKFFIAVMFITIIVNLFFMDVEWLNIIFSFLIPRVPEGSIGLIFGVIGGVGGSVTILSYGYWLKEKMGQAKRFAKSTGNDLAFAYILTGLFGAAIVILSASVNPEMASGSKIVIGLADKLGETLGQGGKWIFLIGFWGAVFSSMLGVWDGVPYIFNDFVLTMKNKLGILSTDDPKKSRGYISFLLFMAIPPMILLFFGKPVWVIIIYSISGAFFMPFVAAILIYMNNKKEWIKENKNKFLTNIVLVLVLCLFVYLLVLKILKYVG